MVRWNDSDNPKVWATRLTYLQDRALGRLRPKKSFVETAAKFPPPWVSEGDAFWTTTEEVRNGRSK